MLAKIFERVREKDPRVKVGVIRGAFRVYVIIFIILAAANFLNIQMFWMILGRGVEGAPIKDITLGNFTDIFDESARKMLLRQITAAGMMFNLTVSAVLTAVIASVRYLTQTRYLRRLSAAARKMAKGDFSARVKPRHNIEKHKDYIDVLLDDFNTMAEELAAANVKLTALSVTDELTKLNNRRAFMDYADIIWKQNHRLNLPVSVILIDIDYFKKYNDTLGHLEGDKALVAVAQCLRKQLKRETDFVARFGGEEFVCLLPFVEKEKALAFAKELVRAVEAMNIPHPASEHSQYVTISAGLATTIPDDKNTPAELLETADKALYEAKSAGRNRVCVNKHLSTETTTTAS